MSLSPTEVRVAVNAFEAALAQVDESASHITAYSARQNLAFVIIESALAGERDVIRLRDKGLRVLGISPEQHRSPA
jgi:hypothetical protein